MTDMSKFTKTIVAVVACLVLGALIFAYSEDQTLSLRVEEKEVGTEETTIIGTERIITSEILEESIRDIGKLVTKEYAYREIEEYSDYVKVKDFKVPFTETRFLFTYDGIIYAGVDFEEIGVSMDENQKLIIFFMPDPIIISKELDLDSFSLLEQKSSIFNPMSMEDANMSIRELEEHALEKALSRNIMESAAKNAEVLLRNFVKSFSGINDYSINFIRR